MKQVYNPLTSEYDWLAEAVDINFAKNEFITDPLELYLNGTAGNDSNDGLSVLTPKKTWEGVSLLIPVVAGSVTRINVAPNTTYPNTYYDFPNVVATNCNDEVATVRSIVHIKGDIDNPHTVVFSPSDSSTPCFVNAVTSTLVILEGISGDNCSSLIETRNGATTLAKGFTVTDYTSAAFLVDSAYLIINPGGEEYNLSAKSGATGFLGGTWGILALNNSHVSIDTGVTPFSITNFENSSGALFADANSTIEQTNASQTNTFTASALVGSSYGILAGKLSGIRLKGDTTISNVNVINSFGYGAIRSDVQGNVHFNGNSLSFVDCLDAITVAALGSFIDDTVGGTYTFTGVTREVVLEHGSVAKSASAFGGATVEYIEGQCTYHGYDDRYVNGPDLGDPVTILHGGTNSTTAEFSPVANLTPFDYYVSTTGNDANDGLTALTPFLTLEKALNSIPMIAGRCYRVNIADGTYTLSAEYEFKPMFSVAGTSDNRTVIKIVGNIVTPSNVLIKGATSSTNCFNIKGRYLLVDIDGVQFDTCARGITVDNSQLILRGVNINAYNGTALLAVNNAVVTTDTGAVGGIFTAVLGVTTTGISAQRSSIVTVSKPTFTIQGFNGGSSAISASSSSLIVMATTTLNVVADLATGCRFGINTNSGGVVSLRNTINISNVSTISASGDGAIRVFSFGAISMVSGATINFTNCNNGWLISQQGLVTEGNTCTYNYTSVTNKVVVQPGATVSSQNYLGGAGGVSYAPDVFSGPIFGYDDRYYRVDRPTAKITLISDVNYTVLNTDNIIAYDALTSPRIVTLPDPTVAIVDITSGQVRSFEIKDHTGSAASFPITIQVSGGANIDDASSYQINQNNGAVRIYTDGIKYYVDYAYKNSNFDFISINSSNIDLYVATTGSDSNDGTISAPFLTFGKALSMLPAIENGDVTIHLADGTYNETLKLPSLLNTKYDLINSYGSGTVYITGNVTTPSNVKIIGSGANTSTITISSNKTQFVFDGVQIEHNGTGVFRTGFNLSDANLILRNVDFANIDRAFTLASKSRLVTSATGNARTWALTGASSAISGAIVSSGSIWFDFSNITISGIQGYGISVGSYCLYQRTGDTLTSIANNKLIIEGNGTSGCQGGVYVSSEGTFRFSRLLHVKDGRNEQSKSLRAAAIVLDKGGKLELVGNCSILAEDCNTIIATSPQSVLREISSYSSYIALGSTPNTVSISPGTQMGMSRIGNSNLPQFSNITLGSGTAVYDTNPDTIVISSLLNFPSVTGGPFVVGETITGGTSGATGIVESVSSTSVLYRISNGNTFVIGETITGSNIGATAVLSQVTEYNLLTRSNIQVGDTISFSYDQAIYTNAFNTFTVAAIDRSVITLNIGDAPVPQSYGPGSNVYTVGKIITEQATKESTVSFASDFDPYVVDEFEHNGLLPSSATAYFSRSGHLSNKSSPLHVPHVDEEIWDIQVQARIAPGLGQTDTYTVMVNGVDTLATVTLSGATQTYNGKKLDSPIPITCGKINTIYEVGGGGVLSDLVNRGFFTGTVKSSFNLGTTAGAPDTFVWDERNSVTGAILTSGGPTAITGDWQLLADGVYIRFTNTTGHVSQSWNFSCIPADIVTLKAVTGAATLSEDISVAIGLIRKQVI